MAHCLGLDRHAFAQGDVGSPAGTGEPRPRARQAAGRVDASELVVLAFATFPMKSRARIRRANRWTCATVNSVPAVAGIRGDEAAIVRLAGSILPEQNDEHACAGAT
jgi:hypothetical protein